MKKMLRDIVVAGVIVLCMAIGILPCLDRNVGAAIEVSAVSKGVKGACDDGPVEEWNKTFGGINEEYALFRSLKETSNDEYVILAQTHSFGSGNKDIWLIKMDSDGNEVWNRTYGGINDDWAGYVLDTSDNGFIIVGTTFSFGRGESDLWLIKTDSNGYMLWNKTLGGSGSEWGADILLAPDNNLLIVGRTNSYGAGQYDNWLVKTDLNGSVLWERTFGGIGAEWWSSLQPTMDGNYISVGYTTNPSGTDWDAQLTKIDQNGNEIWSKTYDHQRIDGGHGVCQCADGGYILTGFSIESWNGKASMYIVKTDQNGDEIWSKTLGGEFFDVGNTVVNTADNHYLIVGSIDSDLCLLKIDGNGSFISTYTVGGAGDDSGGDALRLSNGAYIVSGHTNSYGAGNYDVWLLKFSGIETNRPNKPSRPTGPSSGKIGIAYTYTSSATDQGESQLYYLFDWGDGTDSGWLGPYDSGKECNASHTWTAKGSYEIKVKAKDIYDAESDWSDPLPISMPKAYENPFHQLIERLFERFFSTIFKINI